MSLLNFLKKTGQELRNKDEWIKALRFAALWAVFFLLLHIFFFFIPLQWIEFVYAWLVQRVISVLGITAPIISLNEPVQMLLPNGWTIQISYLCAGLLELELIVSAILASHGIEWNKRIRGALLAAGGVIVLNTFRITATIAFIHFFGLPAGQFGHELLFRAFLLIGIAGIYAAWFWDATQAKV